MKERTIRVNLTESDLQDLQAGESFEWSFPTEENPDESVTIILYQGEDGDEE
jgi:hypothetical protein